MTRIEQLRELMAKATQGRWEHIKRDITLDAVHCLGDPVAVRLYAADASLIVAMHRDFPALLEIAEKAKSAAHHWQRACQAEPGAGRIADNAMVELTEVLGRFGEGKA